MNTIIDVTGDKSTVRAENGAVALESDNRYMAFDPDEARELADALMRAAASLRWKDGAE